MKAKYFVIGVALLGCLVLSCPRKATVNAPALQASRGSSGAASGEIVEYVVNITESPGNVAAFGLDITYDSSHVEYTGNWKRGPLTQDFTQVGVGEPEDGVVRVGGFTIGTAIEKSSSGGLVALEFRVKDYAPTELSIVNTVDDVKGLELTASQTPPAAPQS